MGKIGVFLSLLLTMTAHADWYNLGSAQQEAIQLKVLQTDAKSTKIEMTISGFEYSKVIIANKEYSQITLPGAVSINKKGAPDLPQVSRDLAMPWGSKSEVQVIENVTETIAFGEVAPSKGVIFRNQDPQSIPYTFGPDYSGQLFPKAVVKLNDNFILRDIQGLNFTVQPIQYNHAQKTLTVTKKLVFEVRNKNLGTARLFLNKPVLDEGFQSLYKDHFLNYKKMQVREVQNPVVDTGKILIVAHPNFVEAMAPFVKWKLERGFDVRMVSMAEVGTGWSALKNYVQSEYTSRQISYLILVGDAEFVPTHPGKSGNANGNEADPLYALVNGTDSYPDLFVSRMSVKNTTDVENIIARSINYEKNPEAEGAWYSKGTGIASNESGGTPLKDWQRADLLRDMMLNWHFSSVDKHYDPSLSKAQLISDINAGRSYINYIGHGSQTSWGSSGFSNRDIDALTNGSRLPVIVSVACVNGDFDYSGGDSFAEKWLKAGSAQSPKGAVAVFASSTNQAWVEPTVGQKTIVELMTADKLNTIGSLFFHGSISVIEAQMGESMQTFETWHIFGDASLQVRTTAPTTIEAKFSNEQRVEDEIAIGISDEQVSGAAFLGDKQVGRGYSDCCGSLKIKLFEQVPAGSELRIVFTGFNKIPLVKSYVKN